MNEPNPIHSEQTIIEKAMALAFVAVLLIACNRVAQPFIAPIIGGGVLCVSLWPLYLRLSHLLGDRRKLAAVVMTLIAAMIFVFPVGVGISKLFETVPVLEKKAADLSWMKPDEPPDWVEKVPLVGKKLASSWREGLENIKLDPERVRPVILQTLRWVLEQTANFAVAMVQIILATAIAGLLYVGGEVAADVLRRLAVRIGGEHSAAIISVAGNTIRGVSLGVIGTAFIQALLSGIGFAMAGVPFSAFLAVLCFMTATLQIGTGVIWLPTAIWLGYNGEQGWAAFTVVFGILINTMDNFIKPYFISMGAHLPLLVIFTGVIGGLLAWGFMGMFLGATILAVAYTLFWDWLDREPSPSDAGSS